MKKGKHKPIIMKTKENDMILVGNWKMHGNFSVLQDFVQNLVSPPKDVQGIFCLPFPYLASCKESFSAKGYVLGAQDCSEHVEGAFTGQISASMVADVGCSHVIIGHPERASFETQIQIKNKALRALHVGITPLICITDIAQASAYASMTQNISIAYEPAVGTQSLPPHLEQDSKALRNVLPHTSLLYGGGINADTLPTLLDLFDGFLVGRASLESTSWNTLIHLLSS